MAPSFTSHIDKNIYIFFEVAALYDSSIFIYEIVDTFKTLLSQTTVHCFTAVKALSSVGDTVGSQLPLAISAR